VKVYQLLIGDEYGLRSSDEELTLDPIKGYAGRTGTKAQRDPKFVAEMVERRSALKVSAFRLGKLSGLSGSYISMIENGRRLPSDEAKAQIKETLDRLENEK
jgi:hypothetical protein